jgi:class 3 adenylate cyclase
VICSSCGTDNRVGAKFCMECGAAFAAKCPTCGFANVAAAKFCSECATPLFSATAAQTQDAGQRPDPATPADPTAERRLVTVLFADLVGFTAFSDGRDAEEVRELQARYFRTVEDIIARYGGTIEKFIGDAVMALWGAPHAFEDDAERAVRAGLDLIEGVRSLGSGIEVRVGILTGEAAVTLGATNQGMVTGDMVNTASRLQSAAPPSTGQQIGLAFDEALAGLDLAILLAPTEREMPEAPAVTESTRAILTRLGARPLLARLEAALAGGGDIPAEGGSAPGARSATEEPSASEVGSTR